MNNNTSYLLPQDDTSMFYKKESAEDRRIVQYPQINDELDPFYMEAEAKLKYFKPCTREELLENLKKNSKFLLENVCRGLQSLDKIKNGITKISYLNKVLRHFGATPPMKEISDVLDFCIFTKDNLVIYKPLLLHTFPERNLHYKDNLKDHFCPKEIYEADIYKPATKNKTYNLSQESETVKEYIENSIANIRNKELPTNQILLKQNAFNVPELTSEKSYMIRQLYSMWDRSLINDDALIYHIQMLGMPVPKEWLNLIANHSATRDLSFAKFLQTLQINNIAFYRRNRPLTPYLATLMKKEENFCHNDEGKKIKNPITWQDIGEKKRDKISKDTISKNPTIQEIIKTVTLDLKEGKTHPTLLMYYLDNLGIKITPQIESLLNEEEIHGSVSYHKLLRSICKSIDSN